MIRATLLAVTLATPALADTITKPTDRTVAEAMTALEAAVTEAGATVFARVDHAAGASEAGMELMPMQLLIFGNPTLGTPALQADPRAGLALLLKVLIYEQDGQTIVAYEDTGDLFDDTDVPDDADYVARIAQALDRLTDAAVN
ncbi:DUF302 domain-containing protein [Loktanella sp. DJP18]|uniref:DUF302 domain-containing protein n=1 Tax=Loktanella sp. DJP18 TaxID=3409788 RepID=UPI003BB55578